MTQVGRDASPVARRIGRRIAAIIHAAHYEMAIVKVKRSPAPHDFNDLRRVSSTEIKVISSQLGSQMLIGDRALLKLRERASMSTCEGLATAIDPDQPLDPPNFKSASDSSKRTLKAAQM